MHYATDSAGQKLNIDTYIKIIQILSEEHTNYTKEWLEGQGQKINLNKSYISSIYGVDDEIGIIGFQNKFP